MVYNKGKGIKSLIWAKYDVIGLYGAFGVLVLCWCGRVGVMVLYGLYMVYMGVISCRELKWACYGVLGVYGRFMVLCGVLVFMALCCVVYNMYIMQE